ncbi:hypothetical protein HDV04_004063 [Boothiomyces sp. JEL0838]|nr:hypothetical protein HDV04_004063 [Boothiomyces sp. JEL0838]
MSSQPKKSYSAAAAKDTKDNSIKFGSTATQPVSVTVSKQSQPAKQSGPVTNGKPPVKKMIDSKSPAVTISPAVAPVKRFFDLNISAWGTGKPLFGSANPGNTDLNISRTASAPPAVNSVPAHSVQVEQSQPPAVAGKVPVPGINPSATPAVKISKPPVPIVPAVVPPMPANVIPQSGVGQPIPIPYARSSIRPNAPYQQPFYPQQPYYPGQQQFYGQFPAGYVPPDYYPAYNPNIPATPPQSSKIVVVPPKKSAIKIVNPLTKSEIILPPKPVTPSSAAKPVPVTPAEEPETPVKKPVVPVTPTPEVKRGIVLKDPTTGKVLNVKPVTPTPKVEEPKPVVEEPKPVVEEPKAAVEEPMEEIQEEIPEKDEEPAVQEENVMEEKAEPDEELNKDTLSPSSPIVNDRIAQSPEPIEKDESKPELEEGEIVEVKSERIFANPDAILIVDSSNIQYPEGIANPNIKPGQTLKYDISWMMAMGKLPGIVPPVGTPEQKDIYMYEKLPSASKGGSVYMSRQNSGFESSRGKGDRKRGGQKGVSMSRQQSSQHRGLPGKRGRRDTEKPVIAPLEKGENAWDIKKVCQLLDEDGVTLNKLRGLLNKISKENYDKILGKMMDHKISNEILLEEFMKVIYDKAVLEPVFSALYAKLCYDIIFKFPEIEPWMSPNGQVANNIFRKQLLQRCQSEFESETKWIDDDTIDAEERSKLKRRSIGNIRFVCQLFLNGLLSENIIHRCIVQLLQKEVPDEEDVESLQSVLLTCGKRLDKPERVQVIDGYFKRIETIAKPLEEGRSRKYFMLIEMLDLRKNNWVQGVVKDDKKKTDKKSADRKPTIVRGKKEDFKKEDSKGGKKISIEKRKGTDDGWTSVKEKPQYGQVSITEKPSLAPVRAAWGKKDVKPSEKSTNVFDALHSNDANQHSADEVLSPESVEAEPEPAKPALSDKEVMEKAFKEYKESFEYSELIEDIAGITDEEVLNSLPGKIIQFLLDDNGKFVLKLVILVKRLYLAEGSPYDRSVFWNGFANFLGLFEDDRYDYPNCFKNFAQLLVPLYKEDPSYFTLEDLKIIIEPVTQYGGIKPTAPDFLAAILLELPAGAQIQFLWDNQIDIKDFFTGKHSNSAAIEKWVKFKKLDSVSLLNKIVGNTFEQLGYEVTFNESYRAFDKERDAEILAKDEFEAALAGSVISAVIEKTVFDGDFSNSPKERSKEVYSTLKTEIGNLEWLKQVISDSTNWLKAAETYLKTINLLVYLEDIYRIFLALEFALEPVQVQYIESGECENAEELNGWLKYLKEDN